MHEICSDTDIISKKKVLDTKNNEVYENLWMIDIEDPMNNPAMIEIRAYEIIEMYAIRR